MYTLREIEKKDLVYINKWRNNPDLIMWLGAPFRYINIDVDEEWYASYMSSRSNTIRCSIIDMNSNETVGLVSLTNIDYINQSAIFHIMIGELKNQGCGVGTFAIKSILKHAFCNVNLRRIELSVLADNTRAQHVYEKIGFRREGMLRKAYFKNGEFVDVYIYAILRDEYSI